MQLLASAAPRGPALLASPRWDRRFPVRGNLVPDAHVAALLRQHGVRRLCTADRDFRKFDFLEVADAFA
jgi:predicted nucleic acid-binding protein